MTDDDDGDEGGALKYFIKGFIKCLIKKSPWNTQIIKSQVVSINQLPAEAEADFCYNKNLYSH